MGLCINRRLGMKYHLCFLPALVAAFVVLATAVCIAPAQAGPILDRVITGEGNGQYFSRRDTIALGAGDAMQTNRVIHTIDPWPWYVSNDKLQFNGQRMMLGITRYQANESLVPTGLATQEIIVEGSVDAGQGAR